MRGLVLESPPQCSRAALVSARTGATVRTFAEGLLPGDTAVDNGAGGWLVGGNGLVHLRADGAVDAQWRVELSSDFEVRALARFDSRLYASDRFRVIALDAETGRRVWTSPSVDAGREGYRNGILTLAASRTAVYIGGDFTRVGTARRTALAALGASDGQVLGWQTPPLHWDEPRNGPQVNALAVSDTRVYVGGVFADIGGASRPAGAAAVSSADGALTPFAPKFASWDITATLVSGPSVVITGTFGGGVFDAETGAPRSWASEVAGAKALALAGSTLCLGGGPPIDNRRAQLEGNRQSDWPSGAMGTQPRPVCLRRTARRLGRHRLRRRLLLLDDRLALACGVPCVVAYG